jgi:hypothetical protein
MLTIKVDPGVQFTGPSAALLRTMWGYHCGIAGGSLKKSANVFINVTLRGVRATIVVVEKQ